MAKYQVVVGNIGTVYDAEDKDAGYKEYRDYVRISQENKDARAGGEPVTFLEDGEIIMEHPGDRDND